MDKSKLIEKIRQEISKSGSQIEFAREVGISPSYLSDILKNKREPAAKLLVFMKIRKVTIYEPIK